MPSTCASSLYQFDASVALEVTIAYCTKTREIECEVKHKSLPITTGAGAMVSLLKNLRLLRRHRLFFSGRAKTFTPKWFAGLAGQAAIDALVSHMRDGRIADGFITAINACGNELAQHFPRTKYWQSSLRAREF